MSGDERPRLRASSCLPPTFLPFKGLRKGVVQRRILKDDAHHVKPHVSVVPDNERFLKKCEAIIRTEWQKSYQALVNRTTIVHVLIRSENF